MFTNIKDDIDFFIFLYKRIDLNKAFMDYLNNKITYREYYDNYNDNYMNLIKLHNKI